MKKNERGITLIALVVTIIVLLILAGVSIAMLTGENGIMGRAREASWKTKLGDAEDIVALEVSSELASYYNKAYVDKEATDGEDSIEAAIKAGCNTAKTELNGEGTTYDITVEPSSGTVTSIKIKYSPNETDSYEVTGTIGAGQSRVNWGKMATSVAE